MKYQFVTIGDSIIWGQGLENKNKFRVRAFEHLKQQFTDPVEFRTPINGAHSGAHLLTSQPPNPATFHGEVPDGRPSIREQAIDIVKAISQSKKVSVQDVRLILMDGTINDVGVQHISMPWDQSQHIRSVVQACEAEMSKLLGDLKTWFPNTSIIVTGYYAAISPSTGVLGLIQGPLPVVRPGLPAPGMPPQAFGFLLYLSCLNQFNPLDGAASWICDNWALFSQLTNQALASAVTLNGGPAQGLYFVDPGFTPDNAFDAPQCLLWGLSNDGRPCDDARGFRIQKCKDASRYNDLFCYLASVCHPDVDGASIYFNRLLPVLDDIIQSQKVALNLK